MSISDDQAVRPVAKKVVSAGAVVRNGLLIVRDGASLPDRCIKCNAPAADGRITKRFAYNLSNEGPGAARLIPFVGRIVWLFWLVGQMSSRMYLTVSFCVCKRHRAQRMLAIAVMAIGLIAGAGLIVGGIANQNTALIISGACGFFIGALCAFATSFLRIANITNNTLELKGAGKPFLNSMPRPLSKPVSRWGR